MSATEFSAQYATVHNTFRILLKFQKLLEKHLPVQPIFANLADAYAAHALEVNHLPSFMLCS